MYPKEKNVRRKDLMEKGFMEMDYFGWEEIDADHCRNTKGNPRIYKIRTLGWINCDRYAALPEYVTLKVSIKNDPTIQRTNTMIILPGFYSVMQCNTWRSGSYATIGTGANGLMRVPQDERYIAIAVSEKNGQLYLGCATGITGKGKGFGNLTEIPLAMEKIRSKEELKSKITGILTES
jgi:hypothetical protein